jgi:hypothetical protein
VLDAMNMAALRELAEDLESIVAVVSTRDGDATARQYQRARAVRAALAVLRTEAEGTAPPPAQPAYRWQDIATAPKDGTDVLLGWFELPGMKMRRVGFWHDRENAWVDVHRVLHNHDSPPTHWMPLPGPPSPEGTAPPPAPREAVRVLAEEDGEVAIDIDSSNERSLSLNLSNAELGYALVWDGVSKYGRVRFDEPLPDELLAALRTEGEGAPR